MPAETVPVDIAVFARAPVPGEAKTRLIPRLGAAGAARLQQQLIEDALARARAALPEARITLWTTGAVEDALTLRTARAVQADVRTQRGDDLGARMAHAFEATLDQCRPMLLIGTDCPAQTVDDLQAASAALRDGADVVVQPAADGGYVLIGMTRAQPALFEGIAWGGDAVLAATRLRARTLGLRLAETRGTWDLDRSEDLDRAVALGLVQLAGSA